MSLRAGRCVTVSLLLVACSGCVTLAPRSRPVSGNAHVLEGFPVIQFGPERCGPASLSSVLTYLGEPVSEDQLDAELPKAPGGGVLSVDLLLAARRHGFEARWVRGTEEQLGEAIRAGTPVILMLQVVNSPGTAKDYYHYVAVDGVDTERGLFRFHFGDGQPRWSGLGRGLTRGWRGAGYAMLLVGPAEAP